MTVTDKLEFRDYRQFSHYVGLGGFKPIRCPKAFLPPTRNRVKKQDTSGNRKSNGPNAESEGVLYLPNRPKLRSKKVYTMFCERRKLNL